jgi:uncharacterized protein (DUF58 family)
MPDATKTDREFLDPGVLDELGNMNVIARTLVDGILAGLHRSPHRGGSVEFAEYTEYTPGDEIRHIDWKVYAKTDKYYVKEYEDETNLRAYVLIDGSGSMDFASEDAPMTKMQYSAYLAATFAYLLLRQGDSVGGMSFDTSPGEFLPASSKQSHLDDLFFLLDNLAGDGETGFEEALRTVAERTPRRSMVMIFSDFLGADDDVANLLKVLKEQNRDVAVFHAVDPAELTLPYEGLRIFEGLEGEGELLADPDDLREAYIEKMRAHLEFVEQACREGDIGYHRFATTQPIERICLDFLRARL